MFTSPNLEVTRLKLVKFRRVHGDTSFYTVILKMWPFAFPHPVIGTVIMT